MPNSAAEGLYERWLATLDRHPDAVALQDVATGQKVTFHELARLSDEVATDSFPQGRNIAFFAHVLACWRRGQLLCPLDGPPPSVLPETAWLEEHGIVHAKMTSGSTGQPKLVLFTAAALAADADQIVATMGLRPEMPNIAAISLAHSYGFSNIVLPLLLHGIPAVLVHDPFPNLLQAALEMTPQATLAAVPALWKSWLAADVLTQKISLAISAGAPLPLALETSIFETCGVKVHNFYGSSESGGIAYDLSAEPRQQAEMLGLPMQGVQHTVEPVSGQLLVHSAAVAHSTWPEPSEDLEPGVFRTNDLVTQQIDGTLLLTGRVGEIMNLAGRKLHPSSVELFIQAIPGVQEALVFSIPSAHAARGEEMVALVALDVSLTQLRTVQSQISTQLPAWQCPRHWRCEPHLAANARGKISRATWRERFLQGLN